MRMYVDFPKRHSAVVSISVMDGIVLAKQIEAQLELLPLVMNRNARYSHAHGGCNLQAFQGKLLMLFRS